jgi:hypothetical protein
MTFGRQRRAWPLFDEGVVPRRPDAFGSLVIHDARTVFENQDGVRAVIDVAIVIAIGESRPDFSQIALSDWLTARAAVLLPDLGAIVCM